MRERLILFVALLYAFVWLPAHAANLVIYDDASENGFDPACSFFVTPDFAETTVVHTGNDAISFAPALDGAVSWCAPASLSTSDYSGITFWVNGGTSGGQTLQLVIGLAGNPVAVASLDSLLGQSIPANAWVQVTASFDSMPMQYSGNFDQISIQDNSDNPADDPQPTVYLDDVSLIGRVTASDEIFASGFEAVSGTAPIQIEQNVTACNGLTTERYTWQDSSGWTRSATLSHNDAGNAGHLGELCDYTYHTDAAGVREIKSLDASGAGGFGYVVSHLYNTAPADQLGVDDSPLGHAFSGTYTRILQGRHHAILRFKLNYPRYYCSLSDSPNGDCTSATTTYQMPVTIEWMIATGRDHPLWSISYDLSGAPMNAIDADSRAPYGDMAFDGDANGDFGDTVMGVAWGDHYQFTSTGVNPVTFNSGWTWDQANTIPYVYLWTQNIDAEMGIVQTEDITKQDAGGYYGQGSWGKTSADGNACTTAFGDGNYLMPCDFNWPYQSINYALDVNNPDDNTNDKRLAWGAEFGFLGQTIYSGNDGSNQTGWPRENYSTFIVLGLHTQTPTVTQVTQVENTMASTFSASVGTVPSSGPAGVGDANPRPYLPTGYDRVYGTWNVMAAANAATVTLNAGGSTLANPIFVLQNYTSSSLPSTVTLDGMALMADVDYFATVDPGGSRLWITINTANAPWNTSHTLAITP